MVNFRWDIFCCFFLFYRPKFGYFFFVKRVKFLAISSRPTKTTELTQPHPQALPVSAPSFVDNLYLACLSCFSHDVTKIQTKKLSIVLTFYFHQVLQHLNTFMQTDFRLQRVLRFAIEDAWFSRLLREAAFSWRPGKVLCRVKTLPILEDFAI